MNTTRLTSSVVFLGLLGAFAAPAHATTTVQNFSTSGTASASAAMTIHLT